RTHTLSTYVALPTTTVDHLLAVCMHVDSMMYAGVTRRCRRRVSLHLTAVVLLLYRYMYALACDDHRCSMHTAYSSLCVSRLTSVFPEPSCPPKLHDAGVVWWVVCAT
ncbi:unnamed protein product, partial [Ectocarpus sp. 6 AP-2014]